MQTPTPPNNIKQQSVPTGIHLSVCLSYCHTHTHICILYICIYKHRTVRDTPSPWSDLSAAQRHTVTHTLALHKHMHMQTCRHTLQKSILINAGLALNTEGGGLSKPLISPLAAFFFIQTARMSGCVHACVCIREAWMGQSEQCDCCIRFPPTSTLPCFFSMV